MITQPTELGTDTVPTNPSASALQTSPLLGIAAVHLLLAQHPELAALPLRWEFSARHGAYVCLDEPRHPDAAQIIGQFAAAAGASVVQGQPFTGRDGQRLRPLYATATVGGCEIQLTAYAPVDPLPVREKHAEAEQELTDRWVQLHGDQADWSDETRTAYANTLANLRAGGAL